MRVHRRGVRSALDGKPGRDVVGGVELVNSVMAHAWKHSASRGEAQGWCSDAEQRAGISVSKRDHSASA
jgi:hypothetical protein